MRKKIVVSIGVVVALPSILNAQTVGKLSVVRQVYAQQGTGGEYKPATQGQGVANNQGVRTLKRSQAEISFKDGSLLRINERTDIVVHDTNTLRSARLNNGAVWVRVAHGAKTQIETPTVTLSARGTVFVVEQDGKKKMVTRVLEGAIDVTAGGKTVTVHQGESLEVRGDADALGQASGRDWGEPVPIPAMMLVNPWWETFRADSGNRTYVGSDAAQASLKDPLQEVENGLADLPSRNAFSNNAFSIPLTLRQQNITGSTKTVAQFSASRLNGTTGGNLTPLLLGALAVLGKQAEVMPPLSPAWEGAASFFSDNPYGYSGRLNAQFALDKGKVIGVGSVLPPTRFVLEANAGRLLTENPVGNYGRLDTVAYIDKPLTQNLTAFSGRRRFYHGASFLNARRTPLIADFFTGTGLTYQGSDLRAEAALIQDISAEENGSQNGLLASAWHTNRSGVLGGHLLRQSSGRQRGTGYSLSATYPLLLHRLDLYGEAGKNAQKQRIQTLGVYFPLFFQQYDCDLAVEYNHRQGDLPLTTIIAQKKIKQNTTVRGFVTRTSRETIIGLGGTLRFGGKTQK
jgi:FecR protein